jgi:hypothetical protein
MTMKRPKRLFKQRVLRREQISINGEADYIVARAMAREGRIVSVGPLVFFSTATGDAWMLDAEDSLSLCLAVDGERQPATIVETPERFAVEWTGTFRIEGEVMVFADHAGGSRTILGYPTREIVTALARARR